MHTLYVTLPMLRSFDTLKIQYMVYFNITLMEPLDRK